MLEAPTPRDSTTDHDFSEQNKKTLDFIEDITANADEIQKQVLSEILSNNANVEYLQRHGLNGHTDPETFKKLLPVISYEDIKSDINRIANGDTSPILTSNPISEILNSSGTSGGETKMIPTTEEELGRRNLFYSLLRPIISQFVPDIAKGKAMYLLFVRSDSKTPGGIVARSALTSYYKSCYFQDRPYDPFTNYTTPNQIILCLDTSVTEAVMKILKPDQELADFIQRECSKSSWQGIITRLWPNTKYVDVIITGTMSQYIPTLDYYSNGLPIVSILYGSSECYFGVNINPLCKPSEVSYTIIPTMGYFEFLPVNRSNEVFDSISSPEEFNEKKQQELVDLVDVKLGHLRLKKLNFDT